MSFLSPDYFIHAANVLLLIAYSVRDVLWLRLFAVAASLIAFVIVYFAVFGMGTWYLFKLMSKAPEPHESDPPNVPAHAAGITPAPALQAGKLPETTHG